MTGMYVVLTPLSPSPVPGAIGARGLERRRSPPRARDARRGPRRLAGGDLLVLGGAAVDSLQIVLMERFAPLYDASRSRSSRCSRRSAVLVAAGRAGQSAVRRHGWNVGGALLVTGVFASASGGARRRPGRSGEPARQQTALAFSLEPVWAAFFGFTLAGDRLGLACVAGCAVIMAGIRSRRTDGRGHALAVSQLVWRQRTRMTAVSARPHVGGNLSGA